ncbi:hypothetical protein [Mycobacterium sp. pW045]|uniref:hypothetical protein n=1 Tax=Mycobacterium sp. pW045 TaxID=3238984 RepID=UPI00351B20E9
MLQMLNVVITTMNGARIRRMNKKMASLVGTVVGTRTGLRGGRARRRFQNENRCGEFGIGCRGLG